MTAAAVSIPCMRCGSYIEGAALDGERLYGEGVEVRCWQCSHVVRLAATILPSEAAPSWPAADAPAWHTYQGRRWLTDGSCAIREDCPALPLCFAECHVGRNKKLWDKDGTKMVTLRHGPLRSAL